MEILNLKFKRVEIPKKNIGIKFPGNMHICTLCNQNQQTETPHLCSRVMNFTIHYIPQLLNLKNQSVWLLNKKLPLHIPYMANRISFPEHLKPQTVWKCRIASFIHGENNPVYSIWMTSNWSFLLYAVNELVCSREEKMIFERIACLYCEK